MCRAKVEETAERCFNCGVSLVSFAEGQAKAAEYEAEAPIHAWSGARFVLRVGVVANVMACAISVLSGIMLICYGRWILGPILAFIGFCTNAAMVVVLLTVLNLDSLLAGARAGDGKAEAERDGQ